MMLSSRSTVGRTVVTVTDSSDSWQSVSMEASVSNGLQNEAVVTAVTGGDRPRLAKRRDARLQPIEVNLAKS